MSLPIGLVWGIGLLAFGGLVVASYRQSHPWVRAALAIVSSASLACATNGRMLALFLFGLSVTLVLGTWYLARSQVWWIWLVVLVALLIAAKLPVLASPLGTRTGVGPAIPALGAGEWLGASYLIFRLIHVTIDVHLRRAHDFTLSELVTYALHPASMVAGPIDRIQNSVQSQRKPGVLAENVHQGLWRILRGAFGKFVVVNVLFAFLAEHDMARQPDQPIGVAWMWLIAYSFYILADFAAYSDMAIGFGRLTGLALPENFDRPYLSPSLVVFWQCWHISLSSWLREYIFFPLVRRLRSRLDMRFGALIQLVGQVTTLVVTGLWHGLTPGFVVWGLWHGLGLFVTVQLGLNRPAVTSGRGLRGKVMRAAGMLGTYAFVTLGWVFFAADLPTAIRILGRLFGLV